MKGHEDMPDYEGSLSDRALYKAGYDYLKLHPERTRGLNLLN